MAEAPHTYLTTKEVADLLRLKERKVYDLVAEGGIPCVRATGKLLFPRDLVEAWLARNLEFKAGVESLAERPPIVGGSHDPLLDWALREAETGLAVAFGGSLDGLRRMSKAEAMLAGTHLADKDLPIGQSWNVGHVQRQLAGQPVVVIEWARRRQGLIVAPENPLQIDGVEKLKRRNVIGRQREAGAFVLLERLLEDAGMAFSDISLIETPARTEADVAAAVADGRADAGLGIEAMARQYRLGFVPLVEERYDLVVWRRSVFEPAMQKLLAFGRSELFKNYADQLGGYDASGFGTVHYNGP
ncbi:MAG: helix-turn-helix transcriptional regulator [Hyphomicrobiaceae bacterium]|nr:helix-turn-helix transcriptional regulator [Hyphomicrobiaceae bacterium]MCC0009570.1 helix-turn-helix transcriptional regulator [Hyphomicrobiaceae bacterium]